MGRKLDLMGRKVTDVLAKMDVVERAEVTPVQDAARDPLVYAGPAEWTPDQAEQYLDWRIHQVDTQVAQLRQQLDDLIAMRKRWLAVTGGRSKMLPNGNGSSTSNGNGNGNGHEVLNDFSSTSGI